MYHYQKYSEENNLPKAIGISVLIFAGLLLVAYFIVFGNKIPTYGMGGIIVNYGTSEEGMGSDYMNVDEPSVHEQANNVKPDRVDPNTDPTPTPSQQVADKVVATQDIEEAPAVEKNVKPVASNSTQSTADKPESKPSVNPNALFKGKKNDGKGSGDGTGSKPGNQGSNLGDPLASNYGEGGSGFGDAMLSIKNRHFTVPPSIDDRGQQSGRIVVEFTVNNKGEMIRVRSGVKGTTIADRSLIEKCRQAVERAKLNALPNAPDSQTGTIVFNFKVR